MSDDDDLNENSNNFSVNSMAQKRKKISMTEDAVSFSASQLDTMPKVDKVIEEVKTPM